MSLTQVRPGELLPSAAGHLDIPSSLDVDPTDPASVAQLLAYIRLRQDGLQDTPHAWERFTKALLSDLQGIPTVAPQVPEGARVVLALGVCWAPARLAFECAQPLAMWEWLHRAVATSDDEGGSVDIDLEPVDRALKDPRWAKSVERVVILLAPMVFYLTNNHSTGEHLARGFRAPVLSICARALPTGDVHVVEAALHLVKHLVWQGLRRQACLLGHALEILLLANPAHPLAGAMAAFLAGERPPVTHRDPAAIAAWAVQHVSMNPFAALALQVNRFLGMSESEGDAFLPELLEQVKEVITIVENEDDPAQVSRDRGIVFSMLGQLQHQLLRSGDALNLTRLLGIWRGVPADQARHDRCLTLANAGSKVWFRPGSAPSPDLPDSGNRLTTAFNKALGRALVTRGQGDTALTRPATGRKDATQAEELHDALHAHLDVADLAEFASTEGATAFISLLPGLTPVQALLARAGGPVLPLAVSLRAPLPDRPVERVQLWCGDAPSARTESSIVERVFSYAGKTVDVITGDDLSRDRFLAEFQRDSYDVVWVVAHGSHPPYAPDRSAVVLNGTEHVFLDDLARVTRPPGSTRRLVVFNTCDSAAADTQGPYDDRGIARSVAGPDQAVIGHLWPVDGHAATVFGALLAIELADGSTYAEAFANALRDLQQDWAALAGRLGDRGIGSLVAEPLDGFRQPTIFDWGSAAFLE
ncbi:CHAT domain-containing protein [Streptomyces formicae]|uniref:CHAT domain-containing protein n=1 Tax=Streptomyces formicae TaxID=1616117 RepID=A0ABY3WQD6_9ACTN|nr:CHAT domain-containing protein [Streptomyces formicae]UNM13002.1 CHAT domain-containing protein [Streptomyces formicae]